MCILKNRVSTENEFTRIVCLLNVACARYKYSRPICPFCFSSSPFGDWSNDLLTDWLMYMVASLGSWRLGVAVALRSRSPQTAAWLARSGSILFYSILFYSILFYSILFYSILFYSILLTLSWFDVTYFSIAVISMPQHFSTYTPLYM